MTSLTTSAPTLAPTVERLSLRAALARRILTAVARRVPVDVRLPDGSLLGYDGARDAASADDRTSRDGRRPVLDVVRPQAMFERIARSPKIGIGEAYTAGDWRAAEGTDLAELLLPFAQRMTTAVPPALTRLRRAVDRRIPHHQRNSVSGSRRNIEAHYDLSNDLFAAFLDDTLSYSSALFDEDRPFAAQSHEEAQLRKMHAILDRARVGPGTRLLEIGTGWGSLAIEAARRGAHVTTVTLSAEQAALAVERTRDAGVAGMVDVRIEDYRETHGTYDAIVSVEMVEAVGEEYWPTYFATLDERLAPGGVAVLQAILMDHDRYLATRNSYGWIQKHIFPGGLIPSLESVRQTTEAHTSLRVREVHTFGRHYAESLRRWRTRFDAEWPRIQHLGFDEEFRRKWEFYLAYCEAGFAADYLDVAQIRLEHSGTSDGAA